MESPSASVEPEAVQSKSSESVGDEGEINTDVGAVGELFAMVTVVSANIPEVKPSLGVTRTVHSSVFVVLLAERTDDEWGVNIPFWNHS